MTLNDYQKNALTTDAFTKTVDVTAPGFIAKVLGLVGESGEVAEKFKKIIRNKQGVMDDQDKAELIKELGDVLWYIAVLAEYLDSDLETVALKNIEKLQDRQKRGVIASQGDNR